MNENGEHGVRYNTLPSDASLLNRLIKRTLQIARLKELAKSLELDEAGRGHLDFDPARRHRSYELQRPNPLERYCFTVISSQRRGRVVDFFVGFIPIRIGRTVAPEHSTQKQESRDVEVRPQAGSPVLLNSPRLGSGARL